MSERFAILVDGACDLTPEQCRARDILVAPSHVTPAGGEDMIFRNSWDEIGRDAFYAAIKKDPDAYTTSPPNAEEFKAILEPLLKEGRGVLAITISTGISGTMDFLTQAVRELKETYPEADVRTVDSLRFSVAFGMLALRAADLRDEGKSLDEASGEIERVKNTLHQAGWLDDLSFVAKKGRLTHAKAFFGSMAGIKPIGEFDYNGLTTIIGKARGQKQAFAALLDYIEKTGVDLADQDMVIAQTCRMPQAEAFRDMIQARFHPKSIRICDVFVACGINIGPGLMAAYYFGTPISQGLKDERAILAAALEA